MRKIYEVDISTALLTCEYQSPECGVLVHFQTRIEGYINMEESVSESSYSVLAHGKEQRRVGEHHRGGSASSYGHSGSGYLAETGVFSFDLVV